MRTLLNFKYLTYSLHAIVWCAIVFLPFFVSNPADNYKIGVIPGLFFSAAALIQAGIFYVNVYLYAKLYNKRFWWAYWLSGVTLIFVSAWFKFIIIAAWFPEMLRESSVYRIVYAPSIVVLICSVIYCMVMLRLRSERSQQEKQSVQLMTELKFLRSQISPHFLFNVLTNLVSLARKKSDKLEQSLVMLADLMRYMLYDAQMNKVALEKEVEYLNSYIELQRLRFGNDVDIECHFDLGENFHFTVEPMLLIPFVENAFKHGAGYLDRPYIQVKLTIKDQSLVFEVLNNFASVDYSTKDENSGIGLTNVKTRLNLLYRDRYSLIVKDNDNIFHIILILNLI